MQMFQNLKKLKNCNFWSFFVYLVEIFKNIVFDPKIETHFFWDFKSFFRHFSRKFQKNFELSNFQILIFNRFFRIFCSSGNMFFSIFMFSKMNEMQNALCSIFIFSMFDNMNSLKILQFALTSMI